MTTVDDITRVTIRGTAVTWGINTPVTAPFTFTPNFEGVVVDDSADVTMSKATITHAPDRTGHFELELPATNDPNANPTGFTYIVKDPRVSKPYNITLDYQTPVDPDDGAGRRIIDLKDVVQLATIPSAQITTTTTVVGGITEDTLTSTLEDYATAADLTSAVSPLASSAAVTTEATARATADALRVAKANVALNSADFGTLQLALTAAAGGALYVGPGVHNVGSATITVPSNTVVVGDRAVITQTTGHIAALDLNGVTGVTLRGLRFAGIGTDYTSGGTIDGLGVVVRGSSSDIHVEDCTFTNFGGAGVKVDTSSSDVHISRCRIKGTGTVTTGDGAQDGIRVDGGASDIYIDECHISDVAIGIITSLTSTGIRVSDTYIHDLPGQHGMYIQNTTDCTLHNNRVRNVNITGIKAQLDNTATADPSGLVFTDNNIDTCVTGNGLFLTNTDAALAHTFDDVVVTGNVVRNADQDGISIGSVRNFVVGSNVSGTSGRHGMLLINAADGLVHDNIIHDCGSNGIFLSSVTNAVMDRVTLRGNRVRNPATANVTTARFGIQSSVTVSGGGTELTFDSNTCTDSGGLMQYGIYFAAGDQASAVFRDNTVSGATDYGVRLLSGPVAVREWRNNRLSGGTGPVLNFPTALVTLGTPNGVYSSTAIPTAGTFLKGDVCWNTAPSAGGTLGWVCSTAGSPGTWGAFGATSGIQAPTNFLLNGSHNYREPFSRFLAGAPVAAIATGVEFMTAVPVYAGDVITNVGWIAAVAATFGTAADGHMYFALRDSAGNLLSQTADQGGSATFSGAKILALATPYTVPADGIVYACIMVAIGTGGTPVVPTLRGVAFNSATIPVGFTNQVKLSGTNGSGLTTTAPAGPFTPTSSNFAGYTLLT